MRPARPPVLLRWASPMRDAVATYRRARLDCPACGDSRALLMVYSMWWKCTACGREGELAPWDADWSAYLGPPQRARLTPEPPNSEGEVTNGKAPTKR